MSYPPHVQDSSSGNGSASENSQPSSVGPIAQQGLREFMTDKDGKEWTRRRGTTQWAAVARAPSGSSSQSPTELKLVRQRQAKGEPDHWSLLINRESERGEAFQVKGDATAMRYAHATNVDILTSTSYKDSFTVAQLDEQKAGRVRYWANQEAPPQAQTQAAVVENCQGWAIRVLKRLKDEDIVTQEWVTRAEQMKEAVN